MARGSQDDAVEDGEEYYEEGEIASWRDVLYYCLYFFREQWLSVIVHFSLFSGCLYVLLLGMVLMGDSTTVLAGCSTSLLFERSGNPVTMVMAGIISTTVFQSSTTTNIMIGSLVGNGLSVQHGIYIAMGSNLGNSFLSSLIALAHFPDKNLLERAIAGASVNDIYLFLALLILVPLEMATKVLYRVGDALLPVDSSGVTYRWEGFVRFGVQSLTRKLIIPNEALFTQVAAGDNNICNMMYPVNCTDGVESSGTCMEGIIGCDTDSGKCPLFFKDGADRPKDEMAAFITFAIAISAILFGLFGLIKLSNKMLINTPVEVIAKMSNQNPVVAMIAGCGSGIFFTSSSISQTILTPYVATGIIELEQVLPWSLGTNLGLAIASMLIAWNSGNASYLHVTISNIFFNIFGTLIWYPLRFMREFPLHGALICGIIVRWQRIMSIAYVGIAFVGAPFAMYGIFSLLQDENKGFIALGGIILSIGSLFLAYIIFSWYFRLGREKFIFFFEKKNPDSQVVKRVDDDVSIDSFNDEDTDYRSDVSSIGFEITRKPKKSSSRSRTTSNMRRLAHAPPTGRKRLLKNIGVMETEENCCCNDPAFLTA